MLERTKLKIEISHIFYKQTWSRRYQVNDKNTTNIFNIRKEKEKDWNQWICAIKIRNA